MVAVAVVVARVVVTVVSAAAAAAGTAEYSSSRRKMENLYEVLQTLGRGSFGVVRKVRRREDGKTLVVKEMDYGAADEKQKEQIVAEV